MSLQPGARLGAYEIRSALGAGGMGEVYAAYDPRLERDVAIKVLPARSADDADRRRRFEREARAVASLHHPHICVVHDVGSEGGTDYFVMELVRGESIAARLSRGPLPLDRALHHAIEIADALAAAHRLGVVHRDLKPANVMLDKDGAKLLDFGVAAVGVDGGPAIPALTTTALSEPGALLGTPEYMAPEQLDGRGVDARTDIFAFGALVYEMISGRRAFAATTRAGVIAAIMTAPPGALVDAGIAAPLGLQRVLDKCLAKDPDARWQTAQDLRDELTWIAEGGTGAAAARPRPALAAWMAGGLAIAVAALVGARYWAAPAPLAPAELRLDVATPPVPNAASLLSIALSPDGRSLAFVAEADGVARLWVRSVDRATAAPLKGTEGATYPFWKPDGRSLGFFANGMVNRIDLGGGAVQPLAPASAGRGGAWHGDGTIVYTPGNLDPMYRIPETGGTPSLVTPAPGGTPGGQRFPQFLPGGQHVLFFTMPENGEVRVASLSTGEVTPLFSADTAAMFGPDGHLLFVRGGTLYAIRFDAQRLTAEGEPAVVAEGVAFLPGKGAFTVSPAGTIAYRSGERLLDQLVWIDRTGRRLQPLLPPDGGGPFNAELGPDGRVLLQRNFENTTDIWLTDTRGGLARETIDGGADWCAVWAPDGRRFAFASNRTGAFDLYVKAVGGAEQVLLANGEVKIPVDWSRDGRFLLYRVQKATRSDLWALPLAAGSEPFPIAETRFDEREAQFSPDARWVAFQSDESGTFQIYLQAFPGPGERIPVSVHGGTQPRWRADGRELFYLAPDESLMSVAIALDAPDHRPGLQAPARLFPTRISFGLVPGANRQQYAVAPDGQRFLVSVSDMPEPASAPPITMVLNWPAGGERSRAGR